MCGRFTLGASRELICDHFSIGNQPFQAVLKPRYNIAPSQNIAVVSKLPDHPAPQLSLMHWGLIPHWAKDKKIGYKMINAKAETLAEKPAYRQAYKKRRCLIPADGFYEWKVLKETTPRMEEVESRREQRSKKQPSALAPSSALPAASKQPYYIHYHHNDVFAFAGLWEQWGELESEDLMYSCTIITTNADKKISAIHNRMPVIMSPEHYAQWLDPANQDTASLQRLLVTDTSDLEMYPVSTAVNSPKNDKPELIGKIPYA